jgi:triacylglycerol lipase
MGPSVHDHLRGHLREVRAALRVVTAVSTTLLLAAVGTESATPASPVAAARSLVVLVHGFGAGTDCWDATIPALGGPGVAVVTHRYTWTSSVETLGAQLADEVTDLARRSGARSVTLVGHSLGGVIVAASLAGGRLDGVVTRVVTVAAPLRGTRWAHLFPVGAVRDLRAGSPAVPAGIPWLAVASRADVVVDVHSAVPEGAETVVVDGLGHCGLLKDPAVIARIASAAVPAAVPARRERGVRAPRSSEPRVRCGTRSPALVGA